MKLKFIIFNVMAIFLALVITSCGYLPSQAERDRAELNWPEEKLYLAGKSRLDAGSCTGAIDYYLKLQQRFPFGNYTRQSFVEVAYCYYKTNDPDLAMETLDKFIKLYPSHFNMPYAYYLRGLVNFYRGRGVTDRFLPRDQAQRDPGATLDSFNDFSTVVQRFPESDYFEDARLRMVFLRNMLAQHELNVATYYMRRGAYVAASNRAREIVEKYQKAPVMPQALTLMAKSYKVMGMNDLMEDTLQVLELNYPQHPGIKDVRNLKLD
ncbi:MAG: outer membrane protein assembly factor BamD [Methylococcaceae bacterium TMED69]|nr:MAG: outer membrane protein assembly factor BamD [Methylococcaceae bacterium TMED69]|tara:strand:+ start:356 stop:1153 length:798 start_codon:yes stop_codon:yes gene_type:complete